MSPKQRRAARTKPISSTDAAVLELTALSEYALQKTVIEPLLAALGFDNITDTSGARERGKDLVALKVNDFGRMELYSIQIKRWRPVAKAADASSFGALLTQLGQAIKEPVLNPNTRERQKPNRCLFFTPFLVPARAEEDYQTSLLESFNAGVEIIDGPQIIQLLLKHSPSTLGAFSMEVHYRLKLAGAITQIPEARTAFEGVADVDLSRIYVEVALVDNLSIGQLVSHFRNPGVVYASKGQFAKFEELISKLTGTAETSNVAPVTAKSRNERVGNVDLKPVLEPLVRVLLKYHSDRAALAVPGTPAPLCTSIAQASIRVRNGLGRVMANELVRKAWAGVDLGVDEERSLLIPLQTLLRIDSPILILGGPGAGKSTALRWLCRTAAGEHNGPLPVFVSLAAVKGGSVPDIIQACADQMQEAGYYPSKVVARMHTLEEKLRNGTVRLLLDGLDEAGSGAPKLLHAIDQLSEKYPKAPIVLSCRDTLSLSPWKKAFVVHLRAFTNEQLNAFARNWFKIEAKSEELITWLRYQPKMREAARTPLIAALLCSLFELQADMPSTEIDLYERRYELLLGRWEQAKGLVPLGPKVRRSYLKALETLAFFLHKSERRAATLQEVISIIRRFVFPGLNCTPTELIEDCIRRGVLERQFNGHLTLGHLTYQEYLAACWLDSRKEVAFLWAHLTSPWWRKTLEFYAAKTEDITALLKVGLTETTGPQTMQVVDELIKLTPYTSKAVVRRLRSLSMEPNVSRDGVSLSKPQAGAREIDTTNLD